MQKKRCLLMFSGGLDSRLALKIMQQEGFEVLAVYFKLPFGCSSYKDITEFIRKEKADIKVFDCTRGKLLQEYLQMLQKPVYGRGSSANPCIDCKIFMFRKAREFADEKNINLIVSGEVLGERPMSQMKKTLGIIEEKSGLTKRILRPLSAKLLHPTFAEEQGLIQRENLFSIEGRRREKQIQLASKFNITYPQPCGGCLLCEKSLKKRFGFLFKRDLTEKEIVLAKIGRHFLVNGSWIILGRNKEENEILKEIGIGKLILPDDAGPSALIISNNDMAEIAAKEFIKAYSKKGSIDKREEIEKMYGLNTLHKGNN